LANYRLSDPKQGDCRHVKPTSRQGRPRHRRIARHRRRLASDGANVAFSYAASEDRAKALAAEIEKAGGTALPIKADSADADAVKAAVAQTVDRLGRIDILVNNAGIHIGGVADDYNIADFDRMIAVNVRAVFVAVQAALPHMGEGSRFITTGSITADRSGFAGSSVYSMTKGDVAAMTRGLARDLGSRGITVNTVQPGPIETDMIADQAQRAMVRPLMAIGRSTLSGPRSLRVGCTLKKLRRCHCVPGNERERSRSVV
jgi:3-oxoacyl-[acyl-carrier protein] reductase